MSDSGRRYSDEEVSEIIRRALSRGGPKDTISHDELEDIARTSGITSGELQAAIDAQESEADHESARAEWLARHRQEFYNHLVAYCIINGFLLMVNLITTGPRVLWVIWPLMGWGIGLAFHFRDTFYPSDDKVERGVRKMLKKKRKHNEWMREHGHV